MEGVFGGKGEPPVVFPPGDLQGVFGAGDFAGVFAGVFRFVTFVTSAFRDCGLTV